MNTKYAVVSGFLGAGKTTTMIAMAREINRREGHRASIIANDLGASNIVDAEFCAAAGIDTIPVSGGCICYQHENLVDQMRKLVSWGSSVIFSDIPGCGIGALDHVYLELKENEGDEFDLMPFVCIVDPERIRMVMPENAGLNLPDEMKFLLDAQMAEADLIVLNKIDTISEKEAKERIDFIKSVYPKKKVLSISAKKGTGVAELVDYMLSNSAEAVHREIGYESQEFIDAENLLSWFNTRIYMEQREDKNIDFNMVISDLFDEIKKGLKNKSCNVPHLKMFAADSTEELSDFLKASLIGVDYQVQFDRKLDKEYSALSLIINARCVADSQTMADIVADATEAMAERFNLKVRTYFMETFGMMDEGKYNIAKASRY